MSGFGITKQLISFSLRPKNVIFPSPPRHPSTIFHQTLHRVATHAPSLNTVDRRRGASAVSRPSNMAVGLLPPTSFQAVAVNQRARVKPQPFQGLVQTLRDALGPSSGLDSSDVDLQALIKAMRAYDARDGGWVDYAMADSQLAYTRNLVDEGNGKSNLVRLSLPHGVKPDQTCCESTADVSVSCAAGACVDTRHGQPDPRPWQRSLRHEDSARQPDRVEICVPPRRQAAANALDKADNVYGKQGGVYGRRAGSAQDGEQG